MVEPPDQTSTCNPETEEMVRPHCKGSKHQKIVDGRNGKGKRNAVHSCLAPSKAVSWTYPRSTRLMALAENYVGYQILAG